jgi:hypothetical protein
MDQAYEVLAMHVKKGLLLILDQPWLSPTVSTHLQTCLGLEALQQEKFVWLLIGRIIYRCQKRLLDHDVDFFRGPSFISAVAKMTEEAGLMDADVTKILSEVCSFFASIDREKDVPPAMVERLMKIAKDIIGSYEAANAETSRGGGGRVRC